ncbi:hypothetical protein GDO78_005879 [Eleutherodactylus coqui]|uniref:Secreted protein n=1 Tax=Eleutherodactylus coqui TaxID=57060 RepID=A0A8J6FLK5_ELECQ|nr:hypothetical protein GDO78_005879 [Eleutherodactylus coqui]
MVCSAPAALLRHLLFLSRGAPAQHYRESSRDLCLLYISLGKKSFQQERIFQLIPSDTFPGHGITLISERFHTTWPYRRMTAKGCRPNSAGAVSPVQTCHRAVTSRNVAGVQRCKTPNYLLMYGENGMPPREGAGRRLVLLDQTQ